MIELLLTFLGGAAACFIGVALRMRVPGESAFDTIVRPLGAGGTGPRK